MYAYICNLYAILNIFYEFIERERERERTFQRLCLLAAGFAKVTIFLNHSKLVIY